MIQPQCTFSPFAPPGLAGVADLSGGKYTDRAHTYVFPYAGPNSAGIPTANGVVTGLFQLIDVDSDFYWRATLVTCTNFPLIGIRFTDPNGFYISDDFFAGFALSTEYLPEPVPMVPSLYCPAGSKIGIDLQDLSGMMGTQVAINFIGVKRYYS